MSTITQRGATGPFGLTSNGTFQQVSQSTTLYGGTATDSSLTTLVGTRWDLADGREVKLILAGASNLAVGKLMTAPAWVSDNVNLAVTAVQAYSNNGNTPATVTVTLGSSSVTANQYRGGYMTVYDSTGAGQTLQIASHPAATNGTSCVFTLADGPNTALTTSSKVSLTANPANGVILMDHTALQNPVGVTLYPVTAANYAFIVSKGIVNCLNDGALTTGSAISPSNAVDGAVENGVIAQGFVGHTIMTGADAKYTPVFINL